MKMRNEKWYIFDEYFFLFFIYFFVLNIKTSEKRLKFNNIKLNKKEFHKSKEPIDLLSVDLDQIVVSDKFKHNDEGFKHTTESLNHYALESGFDSE